MNIKVIFVLFLSIFIMSCSTDRSYKNNSDDTETLAAKKKKSLLKVNRYLVNSENKDIENYINRHGLDVTKTGSGLCYQITKEGDGVKAETGKIVALDYKVKLITGDVIYSSDNDGPLVFKIGRGGVESGLEEAILHMKMGDEAIIIIPSHLGHGLLGDSEKIPQRSTIIYEIRITNIN